MIDATQRVGPLAVASAILTILMIMGLRPLARIVGLVDRPGGRKQHVAPTPVIGGIAIALAVGVLIAWVFGVDIQGSFPLGLAIGAVILLIIGVADDLFDLKWYYRFSAQALAALCLIYFDGTKMEFIGPVFGLDPLALGGLSPAFTVVATIGVINALNMADGVDGLAAMLVACCLVMMVAAAAYSGNLILAVVLVIILASVAGFLTFNMRTPWRAKASVFLGNSGSEFLGLIIAWATFKLTQNEAHPVSPILAPFLIALPLIDCIALIVRRGMNGKSPFVADRTHIHHLLLEAGFSVTGTVATLATISILLGATAALTLKSDLPQLMLVVAFVLMTLSYLAFTLDWAQAVRLVRSLRERTSRLS